MKTLFIVFLSLFISHSAFADCQEKGVGTPVCQAITTCQASSTGGNVIVRDESGHIIGYQVCVTNNVCEYSSYKTYCDGKEVSKEEYNRRFQAEMAAKQAAIHKSMTVHVKKS